MTVKITASHIKSAAPVLVIVLVGIGFAGGFETEKHLGKPATAKAATSSTAGGPFGGGGAAGGARGSRFGGGQRPTTGTVTAVNGQTLTMTNTRSGSAVTVNLTSSTTVTSGTGTAAAVSDITAGSTVLVFGATASDGSITATRILLNPSFGGGAAGGNSGDNPTNGT